MLVLGELLHSHAVQFAKPAVAIEFNVDRVQAVRTRSKVFADSVKDKNWIAAAHLPFPGIGHVRAEGKAFAYVPVEYRLIRTDR